MLCAAACGCAWGVAELRRRALLARMVECKDHILCWDCTLKLVEWAERHDVNYFRCPLCRCEVRQVVRDGGGRSVAQHTVHDLVAQRKADRKAADRERARQREEQKQQRQRAQQQRREQEIADELRAELGSAEARTELKRRILQMVLLRSPRPHDRLRRADPSCRDCYLTTVGDRFPITARLCGSDDSETSVLARDIVFSLLEE